MRETDAYMTFKQWMESVPDVLKGDPVWKLEAYRLALFAGDLAWVDVTKLVSDKRTISLADQLNRAAGAVLDVLAARGTLTFAVEQS